MFFAPAKSRGRAEIWKRGISRTSDQIQIKMKIPNFSQKPSASSKSPNQELIDIRHGCSLYLKNQDKGGKIQNMGILKTSYHIQFRIKIPNPSQEPPASNQDLKDLNVLCTHKIKIEIQNLKHRCINDQ